MPGRNELPPKTFNEIAAAIGATVEVSETGVKSVILKGDGTQDFSELGNGFSSKANGEDQE